MTLTKQVRGASDYGWRQGIYTLYGYVVRDENGKEVFWSQGFRTKEERDANIVDRGYNHLLDERNEK